MVRIGSLFSGIGGFELGLESAIPNAKTIWQVEQDSYCQSVLRHHWPHADLFDDVRTVNQSNLKPVDIICGGFPCQDISFAGKGEGLEGQKSGLWYEMFRIISDLRPRIVVLENVSAIVIRGLSTVLGNLSSIGYDAEWRIISAADFGAVHLRRRWFCVAYQSSLSDIRRPIANADQVAQREEEAPRPRRATSSLPALEGKRGAGISSNSNGIGTAISSSRKHASKQLLGSKSSQGRTVLNYWYREASPQPVLCRMDDGLSNRVSKIKALGNAIVPQCSEYVGLQIVKSGLIDDLI